jgi:hypothetical protein
MIAVGMQTNQAMVQVCTRPNSYSLSLMPAACSLLCGSSTTLDTSTRLAGYQQMRAAPAQPISQERGMVAGKSAASSSLFSYSLTRCQAAADSDLVWLCSLYL